MRKIDTAADSFSIILPKKDWRAAVTKFGGENDEQQEELDEEDNSSESEDENADNACGLRDDDVGVKDRGGGESSGSDNELSEEEAQPDARPARVNREDDASASVVS